MNSSFRFNEETGKRIDRFALNVVKEYGRYIAGEGEPTDEAGATFWMCSFCSLFIKM